MRRGISRILIANRGEIACRVMATCRRMGIGTVAVFSDADADAAHVAMADEAIRIGPAPAAESYLRGDLIIEAALRTGADAIHPGYGFLSENPDFVEAVAAAGIVFIGPPAEAIRAMGLKDAAKALMVEAGVPVVPGWHGPEQDDAHLSAQAEAVGWPLLIKAVAGGGGKGMRRVDRSEDFAQALAAARGEARAAFGNADVLLERYVTMPRHIEVQVFGDSLGNVVHLFERDCSLQRRHQKVIEEAPAPGMTPQVRSAIGEAAVRAARAVGYVGAGTVEFIVDGSGPLRTDGFWFMEMNTRLQVEHPVTEAVTGEDLVEWQIRVARGEPMPRRQEELALRGHAVEARLYAEDPARGFLPATGTLGTLAFGPGVRVDSGVRPGDAISPWYDPMIAKVVAVASTREEALGRLGGALAATRIVGCPTNLGFLVRLVRQRDFAAGRPDTGLIERHVEILTAPAAPSSEAITVAALAAEGLLDAPHDPLAGFALWAPLRRPVRLDGPGGPLSLHVECLGPGAFRVNEQSVAVEPDGEGGFALRSEGRRVRLGVARTEGRIAIFEDGASHEFCIPDPLAGRVESGLAESEIRAPMPGLVKHVAATPGAAVARGDVLAVLEAMKMEHALTAPRDGRIAQVRIAAGAQVTEGTLLVELEPGKE